MIRIDDSIIRVVIVRIFSNDDGAASFNFVEVERVFLLLFEFDVLVKETDILLTHMSMLVTEAALDDLLFDFV